MDCGCLGSTYSVYAVFPTRFLVPKEMEERWRQKTKVDGSTVFTVYCTRFGNENLENKTSSFFLFLCSLLSSLFLPADQQSSRAAAAISMFIIILCCFNYDICTRFNTLSWIFAASCNKISMRMFKADHMCTICCVV
jgi:hypothetical protein